MTRRAKSARISGRVRRPDLEGLESRQLLAVTLASYPLASPTDQASGIISGPGGLLWFTETSTNTATNPPTLSGSIGSIDPTTKAIVEYPISIAGSDPRAIVVGPDGDLWFADANNDAIGQFNPTTHAVVEYPTPTVDSGPRGITLGPDGNLWFTEYKTGKIGSIDPTTHAIVEYPLASSTDEPGAITVGPDGNLDFTETGATAIGQINPATHAASVIPVPITQTTISPDAIVVGPAGNLYFAVYSSPFGGNIPYQIEKLNPTTHALTGYFSEVPEGSNGSFLLTGDLGHPVGQALTFGSDDGLWFADMGRIGEYIPVPADQDIVYGDVANLANQGVPGRTVFADLNGDGTLDPGDPTAVTDASGSFEFPDLPPGNSTLRVVTFPGDVTSSLALNLTGGQIVTGQVLLLQSTSAILPLTYTLTPFGSSNPDLITAEVTALYNVVLGKAPDAPGLAGWVKLIKGGTSYAEVASAFLHGTPYDQRVITADYQTFADRAPTPSELAGWVDRMQAGASEEQVAVLMLTSAEFNGLHPDDGSFVQALYNDFLGRQASGSEVAAWDAVIAGGTSRATVASEFVHGEPAAFQAVAGLYEIAFKRQADPPGGAFWVGALQGSTTLADVALDFLTSGEFINLASETVRP